MLVCGQASQSGTPAYYCARCRTVLWFTAAMPPTAPLLTQRPATAPLFTLQCQQQHHRLTTLPAATALSRRIPGPPGGLYASSRPLSGCATATTATKHHTRQYNGGANADRARPPVPPCPDVCVFLLQAGSPGMCQRRTRCVSHMLTWQQQQQQQQQQSHRVQADVQQQAQQTVCQWCCRCSTQLHVVLCHRRSQTCLHQQSNIGWDWLQ
jgi:hypothetical protein